MARAGATGGRSDAEFHLGAMYAFGQGVPNNYGQAIEWYRKAAEQGHHRAQKFLGDMYANGLGVPKDRGEAAKWYRLARQIDAPRPSIANSATSESRGSESSVPPVPDELHAAAEKGDAEAQTELGLRYMRGRGVMRDSRVAVAWFRKAADQGYPEAQWNMGLAYEGGAIGFDCRRPAALGPPPCLDWSEAASWYRRAGEQGLAKAQSKLGDMYEKGMGVSKDLGEAAKWYSMASNQGDPFASARLTELRAAGNSRMNEQAAPATPLASPRTGDRFRLILKEVFPGKQTWYGSFVLGAKDQAHSGAFSVAQLHVSVGSCPVADECTYSTPKQPVIFVPSNMSIEAAEGEKPRIAFYEVFDASGKYLGNFSIQGEEWGAYNAREPRFARNGKVAIEADGQAQR